MSFEHGEQTPPPAQDIVMPQFIPEMPNISRRALARTIGLVMTANAFLLSQSADEIAPNFVQGRVCVEDVCYDMPQNLAVEAQISSRAHGADTTKVEKVSLSWKEIHGLTPKVERIIDSMELTTDGYLDFITGIDTSYLGYAQKQKSFNPDLVKTNKHPEQEKTQAFTWHYTTFYLNQDESSKARPSGDMDVKRFIKSMNNQPGESCCAPQWLIDRHGNTYQLAPIGTKLHHNKPFSHITTGVEIESTGQRYINKEQYEAAAYLAIFETQAEGLLGKYPLEKIMQGHGEMNDRKIKSWNASNPHDKMHSRDDFDAPVARLMRAKVSEFLRANPTLTGIDLTALRAPLALARR